MTDLEMTRACAEAIGWKHLGAVGVEPPKRGEPDPKGLWCLSGGNDWWVNPQGYNVCAPCSGIPDPLHNDAQAMALHKRFLLDTLWDGSKYTVYVWKPNIKMKDRIRATHTDLNRAIVECVAKMQKEKITT